MMRLTKYIREAFVRSAMSDVPKIDFDAQAEKLVRDTIKSLMPEQIKKAVSDADCKEWINTEYTATPSQFSSYSNFAPRHSNYIIRDKAPQIWAELEVLSKLKKEQGSKLNDLERKLSGCADSVTTRKALATLLPEFEKYLPADEPSAIKTLPAVANVVADFTNAGWPKGSKK